MYKIVYVVIGYFIGCIQSAYIVGKFMGHIDIRKYGSGNAGSTNVLRVMGKKAAIFTFIGDVLKPLFAILICQIIFKEYDRQLLVLYSGLGVIMGHVWPIFLKFKGGKGVASAVSLIYFGFLDWPITFIIVTLWIISVGLTKYVSVGSVLFAIAIPILLTIFKYPLEYIVVGTMIMLVIVYKHIPNIQRLLKGTENKLGSKKQ